MVVARGAHRFERVPLSRGCVGRLDLSCSVFRLLAGDRSDLLRRRRHIRRPHRISGVIERRQEGSADGGLPLDPSARTLDSLITVGL